MYEELVKRLREYAKEHCPLDRASGICGCIDAREAADAIEELTATAESYKRSMEAWADEAARAHELMPRWIPVTKRLPEDEQRVLVCYRYKTRDGRLCENQHLLIASYNCFDPHPHWDHENSPYGITVTHWMPLPEPPEEET